MTRLAEQMLAFNETITTFHQNNINFMRRMYSVEVNEFPVYTGGSADLLSFENYGGSMESYLFDESFIEEASREPVSEEFADEVQWMWRRGSAIVGDVMGAYQDLEVDLLDFYQLAYASINSDNDLERLCRWVNALLITVDDVLGGDYYPLFEEPMIDYV